MKIKNISVSNVKSFNKSTEIEFDKSLNIIVGPNGSGKSNLLDITTICLRHFFLRSYQVNLQDENNTNIAYRGDPFTNINMHLEPFLGSTGERKIILTLIIGKNDIENIHAIEFYIDQFQSIIDRVNQINLDNSPEYKEFIKNLKEGNFKKLKRNQEIKYVIDLSIGKVIVPKNSPESAFYSYLSSFDLFYQLTDQIRGIMLRPPYLFFPPYRSSESTANLQLNLAENYNDLLVNYSNSTSRINSSLIKTAGLYFANKKREFADRAVSVGYGKAWKSDKENKKLGNYLAKIGYSWDLKYSSYKKGSYEFIISKDGKDFRIGQASSGEKEIFNFLFGIIAFINNDGLVMIDEPELHLHPKWQGLLIDIFTELAKETSTQFIISTHSPIFINTQTIGKTSRFYRNEGDNSTNLVKVKTKDLLVTKEILHIVNSQNNEKMFFADKVLLVEGLSDRLIMRKILDKISAKRQSKEIIEILDVGSKNNLQKYRNFLNSFKVQNYIMADSDYIENLGGKKMAGLFQSDQKSIYKALFKDKGSSDAKSLIDEVEKSIKNGKKLTLNHLWSYIISRHRKIKPNLALEERKLLDDFIDSQRSNKIYILKHGEIENYFGVAKDIDNIISLTKEPIFSRSMKTNRSKTIELVSVLFDLMGERQLTIKYLMSVVCAKIS